MDKPVVDHKTLHDVITIAQKCQRNYDLSKPIPQEHIDLIVESVTQCPSKQNLAFYNVHVVTNPDTIEKVHDYSYGVSAHDDNLSISNPQVLGGVALVFTARSDGYSQGNTYRNSECRHLEEELSSDEPDSTTMARIQQRYEADQNMAVGVAAGYSTLVAGLLGYRSGCSKCIMGPEIHNLLNMDADEHPILMMGIGHNNPEKNRRIHAKNDYFRFPTHPKQPITVTMHN